MKKLLALLLFPCLLQAQTTNLWFVTPQALTNSPAWLFDSNQFDFSSVPYTITNSPGGSGTNGIDLSVFNVNQFSTNGGDVSIKAGVALTNFTYSGKITNVNLLGIDIYGTSGGFGATKIGDITSAGVSAVAIGNYITAGDYSVSIGRSANAGNYSISLGFQSTGTGVQSLSLGPNSVATGNYAISYGSTSSATGKNAVALGYSANAAYDSSVALGPGAAATAHGEYRYGVSTNTHVFPGDVTFLGTVIGAGSGAPYWTNVVVTNATAQTTIEATDLVPFYTPAGTGTNLVITYDNFLIATTNSNTNVFRSTHGFGIDIATNGMVYTISADPIVHTNGFPDPVFTNTITLDSEQGNMTDIVITNSLTELGLVIQSENGTNMLTLRTNKTAELYGELTVPSIDTPSITNSAGDVTIADNLDVNGDLTLVNDALLYSIWSIKQDGGVLEFTNAWSTKMEMDPIGNIDITASVLDVTGAIVVSEISTFNKSLYVKNGTTTGGYIDFYEDSDFGSDVVRLLAPSALGASYTLTLPTADGNANDLLMTDGAGNLSWTNGVDMTSIEYLLSTNATIITMTNTTFYGNTMTVTNLTTDQITATNFIVDQISATNLVFESVALPATVSGNQVTIWNSNRVIYATDTNSTKVLLDMTL